MVSVQTGNCTCGSPSRIHFGTFVFLICINDLPDRLKSNVKLFADDTSIFSVVKN